MNLDDWLSEPDTARILGTSERHLRRLVEKGKAPERRMRPRGDGRKPEAVYDPQQTRAMAAAKPQVLRPGDPRLPRPGMPPAAKETAAAAVVMVMERLANLLTARLLPPPEPKLWMTPEEAAGYVGLSAALLRRLIRTGKLPCVRDREGYKVSRAQLDHLDNLDVSKLRQATEELRATMAARKGAQ